MDKQIIWKRLIYHNEDLGDYYLVSNTGEVKSVKTGRIRKQNINPKGYYFINISLGSRESKISIKVHRAVAETFLTNENNYPVINHKDGNKLNNNVDNLEFCTHQQNTEHAIKLNLFNPSEIAKRNRNDVIRNKKRVMSVENAKCYDLVLDAGKEYNPSNPQSGRRHITRSLTNNSTAYGFHWVYI